MSPSRELLPVSSATPQAVFDALRDALGGHGPAVFPVALGKSVSSREVDPEAVAVIQTSGSTAAPKTLWYTRDALVSSAAMVNTAAGYGTWWLSLPTHYIAGFQVLTRSLVAGTTPVFSSAGNVVDSLVADAFELMQKKAEGPVFTSLVPTQLHQLLDAAKGSPSVREALQLFDRILVGGQRVPADLIDQAGELGVLVTKTYGSAETTGGCVWDGIPLEQVELDIVEGQVAVSGPMLAGGYLGDDPRTQKAFVERGGKRWFLTDDRGEIVEGTLVIHGRNDEVMISGGVKVDLAEVQDFLDEHLGHQNVVVLAKPDDMWGEVPVVVSDTPIDSVALQATLVDRFGQAMAQVECVEVKTLPRTDSGKVSRPHLRALLDAGSDYSGAS